ncbi:importin subunit alpha-4-like [Glossina fuscipes]|uniref:Importin subunit alpha-4-like n=1 Tax=Glossina fuscipes TaxID=7396 RepID=A0A9C6DPI3_9MUSC|nr:importin subunit alpha-4-like [Glossina fuscipes]
MGIKNSTQRKKTLRVNYLQQIAKVFSQTEKQQHDSAACSFCSSCHPSIDELSESLTLSKMVRCLRDTKCSQLRLQLSSALFAISALSEQHRVLVAQSGALPCLVRILYCDDLKTCEMAAWALATIIKNSPRESDLVAAYGATLPLATLMCNPRAEIQRAALEVLQQLSLGSSYRIGLLLKNNILPNIRVVLFQPRSDPDVLIRTFILLCYIIQEGNRSQKLEVINADFLPALIDGLCRSEAHVKRVAADTIFELLSAALPFVPCSTKRIAHVLILLCDHLATEELWVLQIIYDVLVLLEKYAIDMRYVVRYCDGFKKLEEMQRSANKEISIVAIEIVELCNSNLI